MEMHLRKVWERAPLENSTMSMLGKIYAVMILGWALVLLWACFDIHERLHYVVMVQAPILLMRVAWKWSKKRPTS